MTTKPRGSDWLAAQIKELEQKEATQTALLKQQSYEVLQSLKPSALVKSAFNSVAGSKSLQHNILDTSLGIGAGLLAKKLYIGGSKNIFKKLAGFVLQNLTTGLVAKKMPDIREKIADIQTK